MQTDSTSQKKALFKRRLFVSFEHNGPLLETVAVVRIVWLLNSAELFLVVDRCYPLPT